MRRSSAPAGLGNDAGERRTMLYKVFSTHRNAATLEGNQRFGVQLGVQSRPTNRKSVPDGSLRRTMSSHLTCSCRRSRKEAEDKWEI